MSPSPSDYTPEITEAECRRCGTLIAGLDGRYACGVCGWSNHWSEGHTDLPGADDDPDADATNHLA
ncbi:hypothetical protein [Streptomyces sp. NPDC058653]|uniref:hypothetical protein n=1 Tax=Streptomyces sp. NPDC058653 TaxID=3346576 RepID=UPI003648F710